MISSKADRMISEIIYDKFILSKFFINDILLITIWGEFLNNIKLVLKSTNLCSITSLLFFVGQ